MTDTKTAVLSCDGLILDPIPTHVRQYLSKAAWQSIKKIVDKKSQAILSHSWQLDKQRIYNVAALWERVENWGKIGTVLRVTLLSHERSDAASDRVSVIDGNVGNNTKKPQSPDRMFSEKHLAFDHAVYKLLSQKRLINLHFDKFDDLLTIDACDLVGAESIWKASKTIRDEVKLQIKINSQKVYAETTTRSYATLDNVRSSDRSMLQTNTDLVLSQWARENMGVFLLMLGTVSIHSADESNGFKYLAIKPDITPKRLSKPPEELIDKPLIQVASEISEPRIHAMQKVVSSGLQDYKYQYEMVWDQRLWKFRVHMSFLPGKNEVMCVTEDLQSWQRDYWLTMLASEA